MDPKTTVRDLRRQISNCLNATPPVDLRFAAIAWDATLELLEQALESCHYCGDTATTCRCNNFDLHDEYQRNVKA